MDIKLIRSCPTCECVISYKSELGYNNANKNISKCRKCSSSGVNNGMYGKFGDKNPMFGKTHSIETLEKQSKIKLGKKHNSNTIDKLKILSTGKNNKMCGRTYHEVWVSKYGKEIADQKLTIVKQKLSISNSGEGNPMFGKQSPNGSGNGWSGWYNGWYFRSLRELTYVIKIIDRFGLIWESGESNRYKIPYIDYKGTQRNYFPDFIINGKYVIESKPKKLWGSDSVVRKKEAAIRFCDNLGLKYKLVDIGVMSTDEIKKLYVSGKIQFLPRYEKKYKELFCN